MRLLLLDQFSDPGGAQQVLLEFLPALRERGWEALVGMPGEGELFARIGELGFETARIDCGPFRSGKKSPADLARFLGGSPRLARQIHALANRARAELVYINGPRVLPAASIASLQVPVLFHAHSLLPPGAVRRLTGMALRRLNARVVASCRFVADSWREYVAADRLSVIYNGVRAPSRQIKRSSATPAIGCIGRISEEKGQREFVEAAALIHRELPGCRFMIYGAPLFGDLAALQYEIALRDAAAGLPIDFAGWTPDIDSALANIDLLLVPSTAQEATTRVSLEAFAAGVPVVAFRSGGIPEVIDDGVNGILTDSTEEMARRTIELLRDDRTAMSEAAHQSWRTRFTLEHYHSQILNLVGQLDDSTLRVGRRKRLPHYASPAESEF
jgi:glycosyltransferase involved in cell wall biosynthesis